MSTYLYLGLTDFCAAVYVCTSCLLACLTVCLVVKCVCVRVCMRAHASYLNWRLVDRKGAAEQNKQTHKHCGAEVEVVVEVWNRGTKG